FDLGTLNDASPYYETAKSIEILNNRLVLSNLTVAGQQDFSAWAATFTHAIISQTMPAVLYNTNGTLVMAEYQDPLNVYFNVGYMHNEIYRFGVKVKFKNSSWSQTFWVDDIAVDC